MILVWLYNETFGSKAATNERKEVIYMGFFSSALSGSDGLKREYENMSNQELKLKYNELKEKAASPSANIVIKGSFAAVCHVLKERGLI